MNKNNNHLNMRIHVVRLLLVLLTCLNQNVCSSTRNERHMVKMTMVPNAVARGAVCLDGSPPGYHLDKGFGDGAKNWLLQFEGGGWCNDVQSCSERAPTRRGSTIYMDKYATFAGILNNKASVNPDFYNWNRVRLRYCDGGSFAGDGVYDNGTTKLYFRGQRIWQAIIEELLPKGLNQAKKALLTGCSAGGLATFYHCDDFARLLPKTATVKCMSDAGFFLDVKDINQKPTAMDFYQSLINLQGVEKFLDKSCVSSRKNPHECFFPQYALPYITTPYFILNSAYDDYQFHHHFVPPSCDLRGRWNRCKRDSSSCTLEQIHILQGFRYEMVRALAVFKQSSAKGGLFINSCFIHCQSGSDDTWFAPNSPRLNNKTIAATVGDWYFERRRVSKMIDCPYPCDSTCPKIEPQTRTQSLPRQVSDVRTLEMLLRWRHQVDIF